MSITAVIVLYAVIWFMALFVALPLRMESQDEAGEVAPGTPASAPADPKLRTKFFWVTVVTTVIWAIACGIILSGLVSVRDFDFFNRM